MAHVDSLKLVQVVNVGKAVTEAVFVLVVLTFVGLVALKAFAPSMYTDVTSAAVSVLNDFMNWVAQLVLGLLRSIFRV
jgi:membrane-associated HD superfamily phosphohydrolase